MYEYIIRVSNISGSGFRGKVNLHYIYFLLNQFRFAVLHQISQHFFFKLNFLNYLHCLLFINSFELQIKLHLINYINNQSLIIKVVDFCAIYNCYTLTLHSSYLFAFAVFNSLIDALNRLTIK